MREGVAAAILGRLTSAAVIGTPQHGHQLRASSGLLSIPHRCTEPRPGPHALPC